MTPTPSALRAEAERVARSIITEEGHEDERRGEWQTWDELVAVLADELVAFAQRHGERVEARARLEGRIQELREQADKLVELSEPLAAGEQKFAHSKIALALRYDAEQLRAQLAACEKGPAAIRLVEKKEEWLMT